MRNKYIDLIDQTFYFPQEEFKVEDNELLFNGIPLMDIIEQYGTPLKLTYLPKISQNIQKATQLFENAMKRVDYNGTYRYCYCTKSSHFSYVLEEALKNDVHIETSSSYDIDIVRKLAEKGKIDKQRFIVCNGFKQPQYVEKIDEMIVDGYENLVTVIDNKKEFEWFEEALSDFDGKAKIGIRIASEEEPKFEFYTSRLGIGYQDIVPFYKYVVENNPKVELKMLHFFINSGIQDTAYYWSELLKSLNVYCELKKICPSLQYLDIGGGFPIKNSLAFDYDYEYMANEIIHQIKSTCNRHGVEEPDIFTEFGSFTVGESGATIFSILYQKQQNDREAWNMIDGSFMTSLPDSWAINKKFIMLAVNNWQREYQRVFLGGLTCDSDDYYAAEQHVNAVYLPKVRKGDKQYIGFFNTGAYQESIGGYGGIQHCLIPAAKRVIIDKNENGELVSWLFAPEQSAESMLNTLGYNRTDQPTPTPIVNHTESTPE